jgi:Fe2+ or Zn2+ uptake regulation protein
MPPAEESACRDELRRAGLAGNSTLVRLLALLRAAPETHLGLAEVVRMAAQEGLPATPVRIARQLETLADHGVLGRLPTTAAEPVFDTVGEPHSHLVYEQPMQIVDLHVSTDTLFAILRQALAERPDGVEILIRFHGNPARAASGRRPTRDHR